MISIFFVSLVAGVPAAIFPVAKMFRKVTKRSFPRSLGQKLLGYGLGAAIATLPLLSDVEGVVICSAVFLTFIGFAAIVSLTFNLIERISLRSHNRNFAQLY